LSIVLIVPDLLGVVAFPALLGYGSQNIKICLIRQKQRILELVLDKGLSGQTQVRTAGLAGAEDMISGYLFRLEKSDAEIWLRACRPVGAAGMLRG
jgi:hypothetical protein